METDEAAKRLGVPATDPSVRADLERLAKRGEGVATPPAGWYPYEGRLRWWDGNTWTHQWQRTADKTWSKSAEVGMWLAIFVPLIGFLMGLALVAGRDRHAHWVVLTSIAVPILALLLLLR